MLKKKKYAKLYYFILWIAMAVIMLKQPETVYGKDTEFVTLAVSPGSSGGSSDKRTVNVTFEADEYQWIYFTISSSGRDYYGGSGGCSVNLTDTLGNVLLSDANSHSQYNLYPAENYPGKTLILNISYNGSYGNGSRNTHNITDVVGYKYIDRAPNFNNSN